MFNFFSKSKKHRVLRHSLSQFKHQVHQNQDLISAVHLNELTAQIEKDEVLLASETLSEEQLQTHFSEINELSQKTFPWTTRSKISSFLDILLVAIMVAGGVRGLFFQPFKIPTGSMQPTLYGIHYVAQEGPEQMRPLPDLGAFNKLLFFAERAQLTAPFDCEIEVNSLKPCPKWGIGVSFVDNILSHFQSEKTQFKLVSTDPNKPVQSAIVTLPGTIEDIAKYVLPAAPILGNAQQSLDGTRSWKAGYPIANGWLSSGDHLFVERFSHHFSPLKRGDIIVFCTEDIMADGQPLKYHGYYYIKRLIGLPGDTIRIRNNHIEIKPSGEKEFVHIEKIAPVFEKIYSFKGGFHGHLPLASLADENEIIIPKNEYFALGDNSRSSSDSRYWGTIPRKNIIGRACFVFLPFSRRWGTIEHESPVNVNSDWEISNSNINQDGWRRRPLPAMSLQ